VRDRHDLQQSVLAPRERAFQVAFEQRRERLLVLPFGVLGHESLHSVDREEKLEIHRLLGPQRAVVVEHGDALFGRNELLARLVRDCLHECDDARLRRAFVPGRKRLGGLERACPQQREQAEDLRDVARQTVPGFRHGLVPQYAPSSGVNNRCSIFLCWRHDTNGVIQHTRVLRMKSIRRVGVYRADARISPTRI
jgi:hypothetical protein